MNLGGCCLDIFQHGGFHVTSYLQEYYLMSTRFHFTAPMRVSKHLAPLYHSFFLAFLAKVYLHFLSSGSGSVPYHITSEHTRQDRSCRCMDSYTSCIDLPQHTHSAVSRAHVSVSVHDFVAARMKSEEHQHQFTYRALSLAAAA